MEFQRLKELDAYLTDAEISPRPVSKLIYASIPEEDIHFPALYFLQLIDCAFHWQPSVRLAVGSILLGQPLKAQGAEDIVIYLSDGMPEANENPNFHFPLYDFKHIIFSIVGEWRGVNAGVNSPAGEAMKRMAERGLKPEDTWPILYAFVRKVASYGLNINLNQLIHASDSPAEVHTKVSGAERLLINEALEALNKFEGREMPGEEQTMIKEPLTDKQRREMYMHIRDTHNSLM